MKRYAVIKDNEVVNVIVWDGKGSYNCEGEAVLNENNFFKIGMYFEDGKWHKPIYKSDEEEE